MVKQLRRARPTFIKTQAQAQTALTVLEDNFAGFIAGTEKQAKLALEKIIDLILQASTEKVPVKTGRLRDSGFKEIGKEGDRVVGVVGYNRDGSANHDIFVHENLEVSHKSGEAKFLQNAVEENKSEILQILTDELKKVVP